MACANIGEANADIAGIGVVIAFAFQAVASFALSVILEVILPDPLLHTSLRTTRPVRRSLFLLTSFHDEIQRIQEDFRNLTHQAEEQAEHFGRLLTSLTTLRKGAQTYISKEFNENRLPGWDEEQVPKNTRESSPGQKARMVIAEILYYSSDVQTLAGIALALVGIIHQASLSLYQLHLVYDTINLTSISNCAALASASGVHTTGLLIRVLLIAIFGALYLVFAIIFGVHLGRWDDNIPGRCYSSRYLALRDAHHPYVDKIYLAITCLYMFVALIVALQLALSRCEVDQTWGILRPVIKFCKLYFSVLDRSSLFPGLGIPAGQRGLQSIIWYPFKIHIAFARANPILGIAMAQLPLHLYFIVRLRLSNEPLLSNGSDENQWGFGQTYALIMSAGLVVECCKGCLSYWNAKRLDKNITTPPESPAPGVQHPGTATVEGRNTEVSN